MLRFCAAMASSSSSSSPTSQASLVMLSNSWKVVAFLGLPGVAGGGLLPALIRLKDREKKQDNGGKKRSGFRKKKRKGMGAEGERRKENKRKENVR